MFLNSEDEIKKWLMDNADIVSENDYNLEIYLIKENEQLIVNSKNDMSLHYLNDISELPIQFGTINGDFMVCGTTLESFKGFPTIINGKMECNNNNFKSSKDWNVKEIKGDINLCGKNCKLENLDFLENTKFDNILIKISNTPLKDDIINPILKKYLIKNAFRLELSYKNYHNYQIEFNKEDVIIDDYLNSFSNELKNER